MSSEKLLVCCSPDGSGILLCSGSGARDIADSRTKRLQERGCVLLKKKKKEMLNFIQCYQIVKQMFFYCKFNYIFA
jgi:hypothetical protein